MIKVIGHMARLGRRLTWGLLPESLISFLIVGTLGVAVHLTVLNVAMLTVVRSFTYANLTAMVVAATFNFIINNQSTFSDKKLSGKHIYLGYVVYVGITGLGLIVSLFISTRVYAVEHVPSVAALCGIVAGSFWNYAMSYTFVWKLMFNISQQRQRA